MTIERALFPLHTVLFPGGALPLRIFEPRYVDMVSHCLRENEPFGVVAITHGSEAGATPEFQTQGTLAIIESFDQGTDGLLNLVARGDQRFIVQQHMVRANGLVVGELECVDDDTSPVPGDLVFIAELLERAFDEHPHIAPPRPWAMDDAAWVAYRTAELLPLPPAARFALLTAGAAAEKLTAVAAFLAHQGNRERGAGSPH